MDEDKRREEMRKMLGDFPGTPLPAYQDLQPGSIPPPLASFNQSRPVAGTNVRPGALMTTPMQEEHEKEIAELQKKLRNDPKARNEVEQASDALRQATYDELSNPVFGDMVNIDNLLRHKMPEARAKDGLKSLDVETQGAPRGYHIDAKDLEKLTPEQLQNAAVALDKDGNRKITAEEINSTLAALNVELNVTPGGNASATLSDVEGLARTLTRNLPPPPSSNGRKR